MSLRPLTIAACIIFIITNHISELKFLKNLWGLRLLSTFAFSWALHIHDVSFHGNFKSCAVCCIFVLCPSNQIYRLKIKECVSPRIKKNDEISIESAACYPQGSLLTWAHPQGAWQLCPNRKCRVLFVWCAHRTSLPASLLFPVVQVYFINPWENMSFLLRAT